MKAMLELSLAAILCLSIVGVFNVDVALAVEAPPSFLLKWGTYGSGDGQFKYPVDIDIDASGNVYVADASNHRIQKFTSTGGFLAKWGTYGSGDGQFNLPTCIAFDASGNVYVGDSLNRRIQKFTSTGGFITKWGTPGTGDGQFSQNINGIAVGPSGNVYVADGLNHRIQKFTSTGGFLTKWGTYGSGDGEFNYPRGIAFDASGNLYVADVFNYRIQKFTSTGGFLTKWGTYGSGDGQFNWPMSLAIDASGNIYVADGGPGSSYNHRIQKFTSTGGFLTKWGSYGSGDGQFNYPVDVAIGASGNVYVADDYNHRIQKFVTNTAPVVAVNQTSVTVDEGQQAENSGTVHDADGDTVTLTASLGTVVNHSDGTWSWTFTTSDGPTEGQTVTISADDGNGGTASVDFALVVNNIAPTVGPVVVPMDPVSINDQPVSASAGFSDPAGAADAPYSCTVDYGDGAGPQAGTVLDMTCTGPDQTYTGPGIYEVTVAVTDKDGGTGSATASQFIVIYDPAGGFVTGGGWIDSPTGAYTADPSLTGKANFGFVSKYKRGADTPTGETEFQFKAGDLNFHSDSYDWLVIAHHKAMYKGTGTINGSGNFGFMLSAIDEKLTPSTDVDLFRIKIWERDNGDAVVYDNQLGADDNADPTTAIGGGSIVIHK